MGSPEGEPGRASDETLHYRRIDRSLVVSMTEVTLEQFRNLDRDEPALPGGDQSRAAHEMDWYRAAWYCNRLSRAAGIPAGQWCYPETDANGMVVPADAVDREGFRLPTEAEWEYICRAGTETARYFGESTTLLSRHAWTWLNSNDRVQPVGLLLPNSFGMFDILGNVWEWCHDGPAGGYPEVPRPTYPPGSREHPAADPGQREVVLFKAGHDETWRILRGGCYNYSPAKARSSHRDWIGSLQPRPYIGLRVVRTLPRPPAAPASPGLAARPPAPGGD
jgi:formylglycine-generating enzyme required for sulfatase activity